MTDANSMAPAPDGDLLHRIQERYGRLRKSERIVADFGANTEFALQELSKYRAEATSVGQEWQDYFAYVLSLPEPEGGTETAAFLRQPVTVTEATLGPSAEAASSGSVCLFVSNLGLRI